MCGSLLSQIARTQGEFHNGLPLSQGGKGALVSCQLHSWSPMVPHLHLLAGDQPHKQLQAVTGKQKSPFNCPLVK